MAEKLLTNRNQDIYQMSHGRHVHYGLHYMCSKLRYHVGVGMNSKEREEVLDLYKHISAQGS